MKRSITFFCAAAMLFILGSGCNTSRNGASEMEAIHKIPPPVIEKLPVWRGFNLQNMFYKGSSNDSNFNEKDFKTIAEWGFNFVRIPIDYRILIRGNNWNDFNESAMERLDTAVEYGMKYKIHVCINLHRAPGYTVASPGETTDLWTQKEPQEAFARIWAYLAERYKKIPNEQISFNLVNEPPNIDEAVHAAVMEKAANAIRAKDPARLIIADGREWGSRPSGMIRELGIAQSTRGYYPNNISHYKAEWMEGADKFPPPAWPVVSVPKYLYALGKPNVPRSVFSIEHTFNEAYRLDVHVGTVSREARLLVKAGGSVMYEKLFVCGAGAGEWKTAVYNSEWGIYQNIYDKAYRVDIPAGTTLITIEVTDGDWLTINNMEFTPVVQSGNGKAFSFTPNSLDWGREIPPVVIDADGVIDGAFTGNEWLWNTAFRQWDDFIDSGGIIVGEWGAYNKTPHDITLRWMEDNLINYKEHGIGWALWNFTGSFGPLNSGRPDVQYEDYNGYKLDRKMLELLLKY